LGSGDLMATVLPRQCRDSKSGGPRWRDSFRHRGPRCCRFRRQDSGGCRELWGKRSYPKRSPKGGSAIAAGASSGASSRLR
jgi:hypothetical protein